MKYLNPKADLTFKKVFGELPDLVISFLNAMLPFKSEEEEIKEVEFLPAELVPETPLWKNSIVDVRCNDNRGRQFIVEMQMVWSPEFKQRVLFNASKAYVRQLDRHDRYKILQPVYSLNIVNDLFEPGLDNYYQHYKIVMIENTDYVIEGLEIVFVELPKFSVKNFGDKRMKVLWMRYLTEIDEDTEDVPQELQACPEIMQAVEQLKISAFNEAQMNGYEKFWDSVRVEKGLIESAEERGEVRGEAIGAKKEKLAIALNLKSIGIAPDKIAQATGLSLDDIAKL